MRSTMSVGCLVVVLGFACPAFSKESSGGVAPPAPAPVPAPPASGVAAPTPPVVGSRAHLDEQMRVVLDRAAEVAKKRAVAGGYGAVLKGPGGVSGWSGSSSEADRAWVVPSGAMEPAEMAAIREDMAVMSRILDKALDQADLVRSERGVFIGYPFGGTPGVGQSMFLAGYGALFRIDVDFPLAGPVEQPKQEPTVDKDPTWAQARREIYQPDSEDSKKDDKDQYRPEKVDALKRSLIESLKHASNIRALQPADKVVILVSGRRGGALGPVLNFMEPGSTNWNLIYPLSTGSSTHAQGAAGDAPASTLVLQASKSDIDALAAGTLTLEQFQQKVLMTSY